ncbi:hypothetical protein KSP40_PGU011497 [Platanthera guangdongensis]|uniref:Uncharacterized protein n=1 Tax=Platanthera guangdongensis TaxID=2320717 RepID=A0ABR2MFZ8_9ASPA
MHGGGLSVSAYGTQSDGMNLDLNSLTGCGRRVPYMCYIPLSSTPTLCRKCIQYVYAASFVVSGLLSSSSLSPRVPAPDVNENQEVEEALRAHMEVQRKLHEQVEHAVAGFPDIRLLFSRRVDPQKKLLFPPVLPDHASDFSHRVDSLTKIVFLPHLVDPALLPVVPVLLDRSRRSLPIPLQERLAVSFPIQVSASSCSCCNRKVHLPSQDDRDFRRNLDHAPCSPARVPGHPVPISALLGDLPLFLTAARCFQPIVSRCPRSSRRVRSLLLQPVRPLRPPF